MSSFTKTTYDVPDSARTCIAQDVESITEYESSNNEYHKKAYLCTCPYPKRVVTDLMGAQVHLLPA